MSDRLPLVFVFLHFQFRLYPSRFAVQRLSITNKTLRRNEKKKKKKKKLVSLSSVRFSFIGKKICVTTVSHSIFFSLSLLYIYKHTNTHIFVYIYIYIYYTHTHTHTHIYIYIYIYIYSERDRQTERKKESVHM